MKYEFKPKAEFFWGLLAAVAVAVATSIYAQGFDQVTSWETLIQMLVAASARSVGVAIAAAVGYVVSRGSN